MTSQKRWAGFDRRLPVFHIDYEKTDQILAGLLPGLSGRQIDVVVGIARSGIVPATIAAQRLGKELSLLRCQRHNTATRWMDEAPASGASILLVDDIVSSGTTMRRARHFLTEQGYKVTTLALFVDTERSEYLPDIAHVAPGFIRFAWDRREATPEARQLLAQADRLPPEMESECFGVDMDGILLPDIRKAHYHKNLLLALSRRHRLPPYPDSSLPKIDWRKAHIITGRPEMDLAPTREWLDRHGFADCPVYCRDPEKHDTSPAGTVAHKVETLTRIGVSVFLESELIQATLIAKACPTVEVIWWGKQHRLRLGGVNTTQYQHGGGDSNLVDSALLPKIFS